MRKAEQYTTARRKLDGYSPQKRRALKTKLEEAGVMVKSTAPADLAESVVDAGSPDRGMEGMEGKLHELELLELEAEASR